METSFTLMRKIERKLMIGGAAWFLWGISAALGRCLDIDVLKTDKAGAFLWFGFTGMLLLAVFIEDCTKAIMAAIRESSGRSQEEQ